MNFRKCLGLSTLALAIGQFAWAGEEKTIPLEQVPAEHRKIAQDLFPEVAFVNADTETETDGTMVYEIQGRMPNGRRLEVDLFENGDVQEYEVEFPEDRVPGAVMKALDKKMPGFRPTYIEASHSHSHKVLRYEMVGIIGGQELDIEVSADGRTIEVSDQ